MQIPSTTRRYSENLIYELCFFRPFHPSICAIFISPRSNSIQSIFGFVENPRDDVHITYKEEILPPALQKHIHSLHEYQ